MPNNPEDVKPTPTHPSPDSADGRNAVDRRSFLLGAAAGAATLAFPRIAAAERSVFGASTEGFAYDEDLNAIRVQVDKRHDEAVRRLATLVRQPPIAAAKRGVKGSGGPDLQELRREGF